MTIPNASNATSVFGYSTAETCRMAAPGEMNRGIARGIDDCRDTWADWTACGIGWSEDESRVSAFLKRHEWQSR